MKKTLFFFSFLFCAAAAGAQMYSDWEQLEKNAMAAGFEGLKSEVRWDGQPESHLMLGKAYYYGAGTKKNYKKARKHLQKAADKGEKEAQMLLAWMHAEGQGVKKDPEKGFAQMLKLAKEDYTPAQYYAAQMYAEGAGTAASADESLKWLTRAATAPVPLPEAQSRLSDYYREGYPPYLQKDDEKAFKLALAAAEAEDRTAQYNVALMYLNGLGTDKNEKKAFKFMRLAARAGLAKAQMRLSDMYRTGTGVKQDDYGVFKWMLDAAVRGNIEAQEETARNYLSGTGTHVKRGEALFWAVRARENGGKNAAALIKQIEAY